MCDKPVHVNAWKKNYPFENSITSARQALAMGDTLAILMCLLATRGKKIFLEDRSSQNRLRIMTPMISV